MIELIKIYLDVTVFTLLGVMSVVAVALAFDRCVRYSRIRFGAHSSQESLRLDLQKGLPMIATIASNAPYVGLLGTVFGIMITFHDIGQSGVVDVTTVMVGLALALKATALGLFVAIPSMFFYNLLVARMEALLLQWTIDNQARLRGHDRASDSSWNLPGNTVRTAGR